jgi:hypothetical protein
MAETPCGSVHQSPVRGQRTPPMLKTRTPSLECIIEDLSEANAGKGQLRIDYRRKLLRIVLTKNVVWETNASKPIARDARPSHGVHIKVCDCRERAFKAKKPGPRNSGGTK